MFTFSVENSKGEKLELTNSDDYDIVNIDGLNPPAASISSTSVAGFDGSIFNSANIQSRNIVITLNINAPVEENRQRLYKFFSPKKTCRLYFKNLNRDVYIDGKVETFENNLFGMVQQPQISIICNKPYFISAENNIVDFTNIVDDFEFPFSIEEAGIEFSSIQAVTTQIIGAGDIDTGGIITFTALTDQILRPTIYNVTANTSMTVRHDMQQGDVIVIDTQQGEKSVNLYRGGERINMLNYLERGSDWLQFESGDNEISYTASEGANNLVMTVEVSKKYGGV